MRTSRQHHFACAACALLLCAPGVPATAAGDRPAIGASAVPGSPRAAGVATAAEPQAASPSAGARERALTLEQAVDLALQGNLELRAARSEIDAARARQIGASLPVAGNPELTTTAGPRLADNGDSTDWGVALSQRLEIGGQRAARIEAADADLRGAEALVAARRSSLIADVREAFAHIVAAEALERLAGDALVLAKEALAAAEQRYAAGDASLMEVNSARMEMGRASRETLAAAERRRGGLAALRLLIATPVDEAIDVVGDLLPTSLCERPERELVEEARRRRGDLSAARAALDRAQAEQRLAEREAIATPSFGLAYNREVDDHIVQATVSVPLPIFDRNQAARGVSAARLTRARLELELLERGLSQQVQLALARCRAAALAAGSYDREVLEAARQNLDLAREGYRAGKIDFLQLLVIRREALDARRGAIESREERNVADAQLLRVTGGIR